MNHKFSDRSRLFLSFYKGKDHYDYKQDKEYDAYSNGSRMYFYNSRIDFNWGNTIAAGRWNYVFNSKLFSNTTVAYNHYQMSMADAYRKDIIETDKNGDPITDRNESYVYNSDYRSGIHDWSFHTDFDYMPVPDHHVKFGVSYLYHTFRPEVTTSRVKEAADGQTAQDTVYNDSSNSYLHGHEFSFYAEDNADIGDRLSLNAGIHLSLFPHKGKAICRHNLVSLHVIVFMTILRQRPLLPRWNSMYTCCHPHRFRYRPIYGFRLLRTSARCAPTSMLSAVIIQV